MRMFWWGGRGDTLDSPDVRPLLRDMLERVDAARVLIIATASGDDPAQLARAHQAFGSAGACTTHLRTFQLLDPEADDRIAAAQLVWVCGGSTPNLLALWRLHGIHERLLAHPALTLAGTSAGMHCWASGSVSWGTGVFAPCPDGLAVVAASACAHADVQPARTACYREAVAAGVLAPGWTVGENTVLAWEAGAVVDTWALGEPYAEAVGAA